MHLPETALNLRTFTCGKHDFQVVPKADILRNSVSPYHNFMVDLYSLNIEMRVKQESRWISSALLGAWSPTNLKNECIHVFAFNCFSEFGMMKLASKVCSTVHPLTKKGRAERNSSYNNTHHHEK